LEGASKADGRERVCCKRGLYSGRDFYNISLIKSYLIFLLILLIARPNQQDLMRSQQMKEAGQKKGVKSFFGYKESYQGAQVRNQRHP
jgi:hypothetical protein